MEQSGTHARNRAAAVLAGAGLCYLVAVLGQVARLASEYRFGDFFALWSYARLAALHPPALLYDMPWLHAAQLALGMDTPEPNPYPYPPHAILVFLPMAPLPYLAAAVLFLGLGFALYATALAAGQPRRGAVAIAALLAPTTAVTIAFGQGGFLVAALLIGGLRLLPARPVLAGILFGLLTFKPHFGLLLPVALIAARQWRCIGAAAACTLLLAAIATAWQGWAIWPAWLASLPGYQAFFETRFLGVMASVEASLRMLGAGRPTVMAVQAAAMLLGALCVWRAWRAPGPSAVPVLLAATALATPHAFVYDLPLLSGAVILTVSHRLARGPRLAWAEIAAFAAILAFPAILTASHSGLPIAAPLLLLALGLVVRDPAARAATARHHRHDALERAA